MDWLTQDLQISWIFRMAEPLLAQMCPCTSVAREITSVYKRLRVRVANFLIVQEGPPATSAQALQPAGDKQYSQAQMQAERGANCQ